MNILNGACVCSKCFKWHDDMYVDPDKPERKFNGKWIPKLICVNCYNKKKKERVNGQSKI